MQIRANPSKNHDRKQIIMIVKDTYHNFLMDEYYAHSDFGEVVVLMMTIRLILLSLNDHAKMIKREAA